MTITVNRDVVGRLGELSQRHGIAISELAEKLFSELVNEAENIEDWGSVTIVSKHSVILVRKGHGG